MPARKPVEVHMRNGTFRPDRHPEPVLVGGRPSLEELREPPEHLTNEDARAFWEDAVVRLIDVGIVDRVDVPILEQLAMQYARIKAAQRVIESEGYFARGSTGQIKEAPWVKMEREATMLFHRLADQFALTPLARTRLGVAELVRRSLRAELEQALGGPVLRRVDAAAPDVRSS
jgi:P27 family predicted phage terminase small subunit